MFSDIPIVSTNCNRFKNLNSAAFVEARIDMLQQTLECVLFKIIGAKELLFCYLEKHGGYHRTRKRAL